MNSSHQADEGRKLVGLLSVVVLCFSANLIVDYLLQVGTQKLATQVIRFFLTAALLCWLYRGSNVARWLCVVLFGWGGVSGALLLYTRADWLSPYLPMFAFYLYFSWQLMRSPKIRAYFASMKTPTIS